MELFTAKVVERDSRVTVVAEDEGKRFRAHLRNTGRLEGYIYPGALVLYQKKDRGKTEARVIGSIDRGRYVLIDTYVQEQAFARALQADKFDWLPSRFKTLPQVSYGSKRFDFGLQAEDRSGYIELKSAVTCREGWASYPDAPTDRGLEHIKLLSELASDGFITYIVFMVTHPLCKQFHPNDKIQPEIGEALKSARKNGVGIYGVKFELTESGSVDLLDGDLAVNLD